MRDENDQFKDIYIPLYADPIPIYRLGAFEKFSLSGWKHPKILLNLNVGKQLVWQFSMDYNDAYKGLITSPTSKRMNRNLHSAIPLYIDTKHIKFNLREHVEA